jgi:hypothetical protein
MPLIIIVINQLVNYIISIGQSTVVKYADTNVSALADIKNKLQ